MSASADMVEYYRQRAAVYERVYHKPERQRDLRAMQAWLEGSGNGPFAGRRVLEIACGTGWWTPHGAKDCRHWLATDINPVTMEIARRKALPAGKVEFATVDAYTFEGLGARSFDGAFAGCWWSHVPRQQLESWLQSLHDRLEPGARVVMLDNRFVPASSTPLARRDERGNTYQNRQLDDGSVHEVLKNFPTREEAFAAIGPRARQPTWIEFEHYWALSYLLA